MIFSAQDRARHQALKKVLGQAMFDIKGEAIMTVASLMVWYDGLLDRAAAPAPPKITTDQVATMEKE